VTSYHLLQLLKFIGVILFGGGMIASFVVTLPADRKRAVHTVASPGLALTWLAGYLLTLQLGVSLSELWVLGGLLLSFTAQIMLLRSATRERTLGNALGALLPLLAVLALMVFRPTWSSLRP
jgi:hypothetical protein